MILELVGVGLGAALVARYILPRPKRRNLGEITLAHLSGTYRDPAYYDVTCDRKDGSKPKQYRVRTISEIPEPDRSIVYNGFIKRHEWMARFLEDKPANDSHSPLQQGNRPIGFRSIDE